MIQVQACGSILLLHGFRVSHTVTLRFSCRVVLDRDASWSVCCDIRIQAMTVYCRPLDFSSLFTLSPNRNRQVPNLEEKDDKTFADRLHAPLHIQTDLSGICEGISQSIDKSRIIFERFLPFLCCICSGEHLEGDIHRRLALLPSNVSAGASDIRQASKLFFQEEIQTETSRFVLQGFRSRCSPLPPLFL